MQETPRDTPAYLASASFTNAILHHTFFGPGHSGKIRIEARRFTSASLSHTSPAEWSAKAKQHAIFQQPRDWDKLPL